MARLPRMSPDNNVEAYLEAFERTATAAKWDPSSWASWIGPLLYCQKFWAWKGMEGACPRPLAQLLRDLAEWWLQLETHTLQEVVDLIVLEQFLTDLSNSSQQWVQCHQSKTVEEASQLAEDYAAAEGDSEAPRRDRPGDSSPLPPQSSTIK
uniref:SCAN box domain-containing protein n=1 Tax=Crocodylus porosus TaxID=8502 RepID=A0A7M4FGE1_CROPO